jgi:hypothetical protein
MAAMTDHPILNRDRQKLSAGTGPSSTQLPPERREVHYQFIHPSRALVDR